MNALTRKLAFGLITTTITAATVGVGQAKPIIYPYIYHPPVVYVGGMVKYPMSYVALSNPAPIVLSNPAPAADIRLVNPAENGITMKYRLNDGSVRILPPGSVVQIRQQVVIVFDRGNGGLARYSLASGVYKFVAEDGMWNLVREIAPPPPTTLDLANPPPSK
jgi:hypothetical protein